jgi:lantibiotic modifying enzyme
MGRVGPSEGDVTPEPSTSLPESTGWTPVLTGPAREAARRAIEDIAVALEEPSSRAALHAADRASTPLANGTAGAALFFAYKSFADATQEDADIASTLLDASADALAAVTMPPSLYAGFSGAAWARAHLSGRLGNADPADGHHHITEALRRSVEATRMHGAYDLIGGLVGYGVYALEQARDPARDPLLAAVLTGLAALAESTPAGRAWRTPPHLLPAPAAARHPDGVFDLGVAHGVAGIVGLLSAAASAGVAGVATELAEAVRALLAHRLEGGGASLFPAWAAPGCTPEPTRLAWCYGDAGIAVVLLAAARALGRDDLERDARRIAHLAAACPDPVTRVTDSGLCHGAAGLGHLFNRLYQATGDVDLANASRRWLGRALTDRRMGEGVAGWSAVLVTDDGVEERHPDAGFLTGVAGIGLALLAATSSVEPAWDRVLLASIQSGSVTGSSMRP